jgi:hypothetical protein
MELYECTAVAIVEEIPESYLNYALDNPEAILMHTEDCFFRFTNVVVMGAAGLPVIPPKAGNVCLVRHPVMGFYPGIICRVLKRSRITPKLKERAPYSIQMLEYGERDRIYTYTKMCAAAKGGA